MRRKSVKVFLLSVVLLISFSLVQSCTFERYDALLSKCKVSRNQSQTMYKTRFGIYCSNLEKVQEHNALENKQWTADEYCRMDWTKEELQNSLRVGFNPDSIPSSVLANKENIRSVGAAPPPTSVNYREQGKVSAIKDQGACGACWSFTTIGLYESWMMFKGEKQYDLSEEYVLECTSAYTRNVQKQSGYDSNCIGGYVDFAGALILRNGAPTQAEYPYKAINYGSKNSTPKSDGICQTSPTILYAGDYSVTKFNTYRNLTNNQMKQLIANGPVGVLIHSNDGFLAYKSGVYSGCGTNFTDSYKNINHAVVVVGYDQDGNYIIKNSWDTTWGDQGFGVVSKQADCAISAFAYQYVSQTPSGQNLTFTNQVDLNKQNNSESKLNVGLYVSFVIILLGLLY